MEYLVDGSENVTRPRLWSFGDQELVVLLVDALELQLASTFIRAASDDAEVVRLLTLCIAFRVQSPLLWDFLKRCTAVLIFPLEVRLKDLFLV
jgi:hypothetical protein